MASAAAQQAAADAMVEMTARVETQNDVMQQMQELMTGIKQRPNLLTWHEIMQKNLEIEDQVDIANLLQDYFISFENECLTNGITENVMKKQYLLSVGGTDFIKNNQENADPVVAEGGNEYTVLKAKLELIYGKPKMRLSRYRFHRAMERKNEDFMAFHYRLQGMTTYCEFGDDKDERILDQLLAGTRDTAIRLKCFRDDMTLQGILTHARAVLSARRQADGMAQGQRSSGGADSNHVVKKIFNKAKGQPQKYQSQNSMRSCEYCGKSHMPKSCPAFGKECRKCGRPNHFQAVCKNPDSKVNAGGQSSRGGYGGRGRGRGSSHDKKSKYKRSRAIREGDEEDNVDAVTSFERHSSRYTLDD
jgi:hypothetical protein